MTGKINYFEPAIKQFTLTVPANYKHDQQVDLHAKKTKKLKTTRYYDKSLNSKNFSKSTKKLEPGKTYQVDIFPIRSAPTSDQCLDFLKSQNAILVGAQGLTLAQELHPDEFPVKKHTVSFDEGRALWRDPNGDSKVPLVERASKESYIFNLGSFGGYWDDNACLICFSELN